VTHRDEMEYLITRSKEFLETAKYQINRSFYGLAVFSLEQALQLYIKSRMLAKGIEYPRTHSIRVLLEMLSDSAEGEEKSAIRSLIDKYLFELGVLEDAYITSRYVMREFRKEEAERLMKVVEEVMKNVT